MNILAIPFHQYLQLKKAPDQDNFIFLMEAKPEIMNHLGTIHACAQMTLAEATSGEFLRREFKEIQSELIPVVRRSESKYSKPASSSLYSKASFFKASKAESLADLSEKGRTTIQVRVELSYKWLAIFFDNS